MPRFLQRVVFHKTIPLGGKWINQLYRIFDATDEIEAAVTGQGWYDDLIETTPDGFEDLVRYCAVNQIPDNERSWFGVTANGDGVVHFQRKADA